MPQIGFGADPQSEFTLKLTWPEGKRNVQDLLDLPERIAKGKGLQLGMCLDEFQNIAHVPDPTGFHKVLRASWQHHRHVCHVIHGSKRHMMMDTFTRSSMPFFKFGDLIFLGKIPRSDREGFIARRFASTKRKLTTEACTRIAELMEDHSHHVQLLAYSCWLRTTRRACNVADVEAALEDLLDQHDAPYHRQVDELSTPQLNYLRVLLKGEERLTSKEVIGTYDLRSSANVKRVSGALKKKEVLDMVGREPVWVDPKFRILLERRFWGYRLRP